MKAKKTPFKAKQGAETNPLPILFDLDLPEYVKEARILAMAASMNAAVMCASGGCDCKKKGFDNHLNEVGQSFLAFDFVRIYLSTAINGKRGANDEPRFRAIFAETTPRVYPAFLAFLQRSPDALAALKPLSHINRMTTLNAAALAQVHLLSTPPDKPLPLTWPAISAPMQKNEVH